MSKERKEVYFSFSRNTLGFFDSSMQIVHTVEVFFAIWYDTHIYVLYIMVGC